MQSVLEPDEKGSEYVDNQSSWPTENDAKASGKMILVVKSKKVCVGSQVLSLPTFDGRLGSQQLPLVRNVSWFMLMSWMMSRMRL